MSATINCKEFAEYFGTPLRNQVNPAFIFEVEGAPYAIEQFYLDDLRGLIPIASVPLHWDEPGISPQMYNIAISLIESFDTLEDQDHSPKEVSKGVVNLPVRGSVLVFLPGLAEIQYMQDALSKLGRRSVAISAPHGKPPLHANSKYPGFPTAPGFPTIQTDTHRTSYSQMHHMSALPVQAQHDN
ncbi:ATP-dependent RNA helicase TDRD9-like, partial [Engraulis encrasicolus]|uniref:ATP-dependent RNA helicase TDRD9-like n=1 Tax=Engraulis encrasicolus TaxID=184585 RepID=UPI002FD04A34